MDNNYASVLLAILILLLTGCAELPKPAPQPAAPRHHVSVAKKPAAKPVAASPQPAPAEQDKPATFLERWFDKFRKHGK